MAQKRKTTYFSIGFNFKPAAQISTFYANGEK